MALVAETGKLLLMKQQIDVMALSLVLIQVHSAVSKTKVGLSFHPDHESFCTV